MFHQPLVNSPKEAYQILSAYLAGHQSDASQEEQIRKIIDSEKFNLNELINETLPKVCEKYVSVLNEKSSSMAKRYMFLADTIADTVVFPFPSTRLQHLNNAIKCLPPENTGKLAKLYGLRAEMLLSKQDYVDAMENIEMAQRLRPNYPKFFLTHIRILQKLNKLSEASAMIHNRRNVISPADMTPDFNQHIKEMKQEIKRAQKYPLELSEKVQKQFEPKPRYEFTLRMDQNLSVDYRNEKNRNFCVKASNRIPEGTVLFEETPSSIITNAPELSDTCVECGRECANTFLPCSLCPDAIFCSERCRTVSLDNDGIHRQECLFIPFFTATLGSSGYQFYRILTSLGLDNYLDIIEAEESQRFDLPNLVEAASKNIHPSRFELVRLFAMSQRASRERFMKFHPNRTVDDFAKALMIFGIYLYKNPKFVGEYSDEQLVKLFSYMSIDVAKMRAMEFCHTKKEKKGNQKVFNALQTLLASTLAPSCAQNSSWNWNGKAFVLSSVKDIEAGEELTISYGSTGLAFFERQKNMNSFGTFCTCSKCSSDVLNEFSVKCPKCSGPIPFQDSLFENRVCFDCFEINSEMDVSQVRTTYQQFVNCNRVADLYQIAGSTQDAERVLHVENFFVRLFQNVYINCKPMLISLQKLSLAHIKHGFKYMGASWYQWLKEHYGIYLSDVKQCSTMENFQIYYSFADALLNSSLVRNETSMVGSALELYVHMKYSIQHEQLIGKDSLKNDSLIAAVMASAKAQLAQLNELLVSVQDHFIKNGLMSMAAVDEQFLQASLEESEAGARQNGEQEATPAPDSGSQHNDREGREEDDYEDEIQFELTPKIDDIPPFIATTPPLVSDAETTSSSASGQSESDDSDADEIISKLREAQQIYKRRPNILSESDDNSEQDMRIEVESNSECSQSQSGVTQNLSESLIVGDTSSDSDSD